MTKEQAINDLEERAKALNRIIKVCEEAKCPAGQYREMEEMKDAIGTVLSMLEEKDKIIDLMANHIATSDSDLCEYLDITTKCKYYAGDNGKTCDNCIKQYYENKAKEFLNK